MMRIQKSTLMYGLFSMLLLTLFFTKGVEAQEVLVVAQEDAIENMNHITTTWMSEPVMNVYDNLITRDYENQLKDGLAHHWEVSEDGLTYTFYLKEGVVFHDGTPFNASAVKWNIEAIAGGVSSYLVAAVHEVEIVDDYTVQLHLHHPFPNLLYNLSTSYAGIISPTAYEELGDAYGSRTVVGTGPFLLKEWIRGDRVILEAFDEYDWGPSWLENQKRPYYDEVVFKILPEATTQVMELEAGEVHMLTATPPPLAERLKTNENIRVETGPDRNIIYIGMNVKHPELEDINVRKAINYAIDRESIVEFIFDGYGLPAYHYLIPTLESHHVESPYYYNPEYARELLVEAGYELGDDGIVVRDGEPLHFVLWVETITTRRQIAEVAQQQLREIGIDVSIEQFDPAGYKAAFDTEEQELFVRLYSWDNADILEWFFHSHRRPEPNKTLWNRAGFDSMVEQAEASTTWEQRVGAYKAVHSYLLAESPWASVYYPDRIVSVRDSVGGLVVHPVRIQYSQLYRR